MDKISKDFEIVKTKGGPIQIKFSDDDVCKNESLNGLKPGDRCKCIEDDIEFKKGEYYDVHKVEHGRVVFLDPVFGTEVDYIYPSVFKKYWEYDDENNIIEESNSERYENLRPGDRCKCVKDDIEFEKDKYYCIHKVKHGKVVFIDPVYGTEVDYSYPNTFKTSWEYSEK